MDFTPRKYTDIMQSAIEAGYDIHPLHEWYVKLQQGSSSGVMVRHDVDRRPENALNMALIEHGLGIRSTYYFRVVGSAFDVAKIEAIANLGHEIGYHYEDWSLAGGNAARAIELFETNLARLRQIAPIQSIVMHGSPLSRENNMTLWDHVDFAQYDVIDGVLSFDYANYIFFTDSGRTFGQSKSNLRDYLGDAKWEASVQSSDDVCAYLRSRRAQLIQINVHPERWNEPGWNWSRQFAIDTAANGVKRLLRLVRRPERKHAR
ncbi:hypothetical protein [Devosia lacusdianchii]|uniref:hypothetical protein n=1 Tax=Devosia lacusdianchii TaxID=2917991 RepID=UPI001F051BA6|nr:hypothetical protein [Devosia sp. JXJ CY 41]